MDPQEQERIPGKHPGNAAKPLESGVAFWSLCSANRPGALGGDVGLAFFLILLLQSPHVRLGTGSRGC